jgi:hypothetical protein
MCEERESILNGKSKERKKEQGRGEEIKSLSLSSINAIAVQWICLYLNCQYSWSPG